MSFLGPLLSAGASILGSVIGAKSQKSANEDNYAAQKEFAQHGVSWKVADAKAAGLHPLYALGGAGATYSPSAQPVFNGAELGQNLSRAATSFFQRDLQAAQLDAVKAGAEKDRALAAAADSEAARNRQALNQTAPVAQAFAVDLPGVSMNPQWSGEHIPQALPGNPSQLFPVKSVPPYLASGDAAPGFKTFNVPGIGEVILPNASSMSEALESFENPVLQAAVAGANAVHYGPAGAARLARLTGRAWSDPLGAAVDYARSKLPPGVYRKD